MVDYNGNNKFGLAVQEPKYETEFTWVIGTDVDRHRMRYLWSLIFNDPVNEENRLRCEEKLLEIDVKLTQELQLKAKMGEEACALQHSGEVIFDEEVSCKYSTDLRKIILQRDMLEKQFYKLVRLEVQLNSQENKIKTVLQIGMDTNEIKIKNLAAIHPINKGNKTRCDEKILEIKTAYSNEEMFNSLIERRPVCEADEESMLEKEFLLYRLKRLRHECELFDIIISHKLIPTVQTVSIFNRRFQLLESRRSKRNNQRKAIIEKKHELHKRRRNLSIKRPSKQVRTPSSVASLIFNLESLTIKPPLS